MIKTLQQKPGHLRHARHAAATVDRPHVTDHYAALHQGFTWQVPEYFNIADVCCNRWAENTLKNQNTPNSIAVQAYKTPATSLFHTYLALKQAADALSHALTGLGVARGDRVAIVMPQRFETAVAYMAVFQMGAVAMPLSMLFGPEALQYRLADSAAVVAICDESSITNVTAARADCPALRTVVAVGQARGDVQYDDLIPSELSKNASAGVFNAYPAIKTKAIDAAILIYTSGTTGPPKGALLPHQALIGNLPGFVCSQNWFGFDGQRNAASEAVFWSPADWAWTGGLMDALLPTLYFGRPIVAFNGRFSPQTAFELMQNCGVTHTFLFPTALKAMMKAYPQPRQHFQLQLQGLMSAGEAVGGAVFDYCQGQLGVTVNEMFGQTEINYIVGNCAMNCFSTAPTGLEPAAPNLPEQVWKDDKSEAAGKRRPARHSAVRQRASVGAPIGWPARAGSMGKPYPGHRVAVIDDDGNECPVGMPGDVAVHRFDVHGAPDPIFFLGYWQNPAATRAKFTGKNGVDNWCRTGDMARRDAEGYLWYEGRADDIFKAAGYRIGPGEIENCLLKHPSVANAAVVPKPDKARGNVVKAYVVLTPDLIALRASKTPACAAFDADIIAQLQTHVKTLLAPYEYPKEIELIDALPMTTTGKVQRRVLRLQEEARYKLSL
ncbi:MAG: AMP-binding protein [Chitinophagaceae bacterium]|nr:AMP-binding protein [Polaromonas sp.]